MYVNKQRPVQLIMKRRLPPESKKASKQKRTKTIVNDEDDDDLNISQDSVVDDPIDVSDLKKTVYQLQQTVSDLKSQVEFLMSALGWTLPQLSAAASSGKSVNQSSVPSAEESTSSSSSSQAATYAAAVRHPASLQRTIRDAVVAAVYVDQKKKDNRAGNIVVSGLQPSHSVSDHDVISNLCRTEMNITPDIVQCKRLGKSTVGKIQPLLVVLRSPELAEEIVHNARQLRKSQHEAIRQNVFINRHMTPAESRAAYELRCQRRTTMQKRTTTTAEIPANAAGTPPNPTISWADASAASPSSVAPHSSSTRIPTSKVNSKLVLNTAVQEFIPAAQSSM